jgi:hypothetical protein
MGAGQAVNPSALSGNGMLNIWGTSATDIFAVSGYGGIFHYGEHTTTSSIPDSTTTSSSTTTTATNTGIFCPSESIYGEHSEQTELLRQFRDSVLSQTPEGQEIIKLYYEWSSAIVKAMEADEEFKEGVREMVDGVLDLIGGGVE